MGGRVWGGVEGAGGGRRSCLTNRSISIDSQPDAPPIAPPTRVSPRWRPGEARFFHFWQSESLENSSERGNLVHRHSAPSNRSPAHPLLPRRRPGSSVAETPELTETSTEAAAGPAKQLYIHTYIHTYIHKIPKKKKHHSQKIQKLSASTFSRYEIDSDFYNLNISIISKTYLHTTYVHTYIDTY